MQTTSTPVTQDQLASVAVDGSGDSTAPPLHPAPAAPPDDEQRRRRRRHRKRFVKRVLTVLAIAAVLAVCGVFGLWIVPVVFGVFLLCGILDIRRHDPLTIGTVDRYFFGNGILTWILSPFNLLMDLLALPYVNTGVYELADLPEQHQRDITRVLDAARDADLIRQLEDKITDGRSMLFFKWYGRNLRVSVDVPAFHEEYATIRTIGVSVFNKRRSTSWHFGPLRATFRVLYNLRPTPDDAAFIQVGDLVHRWNAKPLFIFDDTLMHQSRNETDHVRYCMFIDIVRPNRVGPLMNAVVAVLQLLLIRINRNFYKRWAMIK